MPVEPSVYLHLKPTMRLLYLTLLSILTLAPLGCSPPAQQAPTRPQEQSSSEPRSERRSESRAAQRADRQTGYGSDRQTDGQSAEPSNNSSRAPRARPTTAAPGAFDFYLLTLSWSPEFCATHSAVAECALHAGFVLHGLWPQNTDASYPEHCSNAPGPANPSQYSDIFPDVGLLQHEWTTHGTCSGLAPDAYFQLARRAYKSIHTPPSLNTLAQQTSESPDAILTQFASINPSVARSSLALSCGNNYLTAVQVCLAKDLSATACDVRTCRANVVRIVPPGSPSTN